MLFFILIICYKNVLRLSILYFAIPNCLKNNRNILLELNVQGKTNIKVNIISFLIKKNETENTKSQIYCTFFL